MAIPPFSQMCRRFAHIFAAFALASVLAAPGVGILVVPGTSSAENAGKFDLAAHITFLLSKYSTWPNGPGAGGEVLVGVYGGAQAEKSFAAAMNGKKLDGSSIRVVSVHAETPAEDVVRCAILFTTTNADLNRAAAATNGNAVLLVHFGDGNGTSCISLFEDGGKLAFDVSMQPLKKRKLRMSSQALKLATNVHK